MIEFWKKGADEAQQGRHSEAIKSFLDMPEPGARIYFNIANMYVCLGNIEEAEKVRKTGQYINFIVKIFNLICELYYCF